MFKKTISFGVCLLLLFAFPMSGLAASDTAGAGPVAACSYLLGPADANGVSPVLAGGCGANALAQEQITTNVRILRLYDGTYWTYPMIDYYGASPCNGTITYGDPQVPSAYNNKTSSVSTFNQCNYLYIYDGANYTGFLGSCFQSCSSLGTMNDKLTSWKLFF